MVRVHPRLPVLHAGVVQWIRTPGYEPGDLEVQILPPVPRPFVQAWTGHDAPNVEMRVRLSRGRPSMRVLRGVRPSPAPRHGADRRFKSGRTRQSLHPRRALWGSRQEEKPPDLQSGDREFESLLSRQDPWPVAQLEERPPLKRERLGSKPSGPTKVCGVAER